MSTAQHSLTLTCIDNGTTYSTLLTCSTGDLFQRYDATNVYPNWETSLSLCPVITLHMASSSEASGSGEDIPDNIELFYDNEKVSFPEGSSQSNIASGNIPAGMFQIIGGGTKQFQIKVLKNFCSPSANTTQAGHSIKVIALKDGNRMPATIGVDIKPKTGSGQEVHIVDGGTTENPFVVNENKGINCILKAEYYVNAAKVSIDTSKITIVWEKQHNGGWTTMSAMNGSPEKLEVKPGDVESYAVFRVTLYDAADTSKANPICSDTQSVMDIGDPYFIGVEITDGSGADADLSFRANEAASALRKFVASLKSRNAATSIPSVKKTTCSITDAAGVILNAGTTDPKSNSTDITTSGITITKKFVKDNNMSVNTLFTIEYND